MEGMASINIPRQTGCRVDPEVMPCYAMARMPSSLQLLLRGGQQASSFPGR